jgi:sugar/nucleoside kinase (ribokinase family)
MWLSVSGLSEEPSRAAHHAVLEARARKPFTVLDLDYRPMFWADAAAAREQVQRVLPQITVAVGNRTECEVATGESDPTGRPTRCWPPAPSWPWSRWARRGARPDGDQPGGRAAAGDHAAERAGGR